MNNGRDAFLKLVTPAHLYTAALIFSIVTFLIVVMIYAFLYSKKRRYRTKTNVTEILNSWLSDILLDMEPNLNISDELGKYLNKRNNRHFIIDSLINVKKNFTGRSVDNVIQLYKNLGFREDSIRKMNSLQWHEKARGLYELYMMNQRNEFPDMFEYTNSKNPYVRMEAQTAIIGFSGFSGLAFLDTLTYPLHEWQQIKLLEQLATLDTEEMSHLPLWLQSENKYVVQFALKLTEIYQRYEVHDIVVECLEDDKDKIRTQAIITLGKIAMPETIGILKKYYTGEIAENRKKIIQQIKTNGSHDDMPFLIDLLHTSDAEITLEAARAVIALDKKADSFFANHSFSDMHSQIFAQVKEERIR